MSTGLTPLRECTRETLRLPCHQCQGEEGHLLRLRDLGESQTTYTHLGSPECRTADVARPNIPTVASTSRFAATRYTPAETRKTDHGTKKQTRVHVVGACTTGMARHAGRGWAGSPGNKKAPFGRFDRVATCLCRYSSCLCFPEERTDTLSATEHICAPTNNKRNQH